MAEKPENLTYLDACFPLARMFFVDMSARTAELGRQPYTARDFFLKTCRPNPVRHRFSAHHRDVPIAFPFLETADEYFEYPSHASRQGRWNIYGLHLPDDVLRKIYRENALRLFALRR